MSVITKTPLEILKEAASMETFTVTDMLRDQIKAEFKDTYAEIDTVEEAIEYRPEMIPVFESADKSAYYVEMDNVIKYMKSANIKNIKEALENIAEGNELKPESMAILIESDDWALSVLEEAEESEDKAELEKIQESIQLIKKLKDSGINLAKKQSVNEFTMLYNAFCESINLELIEEASIEKLQARKKKYEENLKKIQEKENGGTDFLIKKKVKLKTKN